MIRYEPQTIEAKMIRAELRGDYDLAQRLLDDLLKAGCDFRILSGAFMYAVLHRFGDLSDLRLITKFVADHSNRSSHMGRLPPREVEAMIRAALGELYLLDAVPRDLVVEIQWAVLAAIVSDQNLPREKVDEFLLCAERQGDLIERFGVLDALRREASDDIHAGGSEVNPGRWELPHVKMGVFSKGAAAKSEEGFSAAEGE